jgi:hypothetical protein
MQAERLPSFPLAMVFGSRGPSAVRQDRMRCKDVLIAVAHRHIRILLHPGTALSFDIRQRGLALLRNQGSGLSDFADGLLGGGTDTLCPYPTDYR